MDPFLHSGNFSRTKKQRTGRDNRVRMDSRIRRDSRSWRQPMNLKSILQIKLSSLPPPCCTPNSLQAHGASPALPSGTKADPTEIGNSRNRRKVISYSKIVFVPPPCHGLSLPLVRAGGDSGNGTGNGTRCGFLSSAEHHCLMFHT